MCVPTSLPDRANHLQEQLGPEFRPQRTRIDKFIAPLRCVAEQPIEIAQTPKVGLTGRDTGKAGRAVDDQSGEAPFFEERSAQPNQHFLLGEVDAPLLDDLVDLDEDAAINDRFDTSFQF